MLQEYKDYSVRPGKIHFNNFARILKKFRSINFSSFHYDIFLNTYCIMLDIFCNNLISSDFHVQYVLISCM